MSHALRPRSSATWFTLSGRFGVAALLLAVGLTAGLPRTLHAQDGEKKVPAPVDVNLQTADGVRLRATYFASTRGKESVPVVLLHEFKGSRHDMAALATSLQKNHGFAVVTVDLRGHGDSTEVVDMDKKLDCNSPTFTPQFPRMVKYDLEAVKTFLFEKNDAGELNVDKLCVVGAEMGASVGFLWSIVDWSWPQLTTNKQGQDVKGIVMISPEPAFKTLRMTAITPDCIPDVLLQKASPQSIQQADNDVRSKVSIYVVVGARDSSAVGAANRVYTTFTKFRKPPAKKEDRDLFFDNSPDTKLQGSKLLQEKSLGVEDNIVAFIQARCADQVLPWSQRKTQ